jgi:hypothetical protein
MLSTSEKVAALLAKGSEKELREALALMQSENDALKAAQIAAQGVITAKVGKRGGISVYGLQRQPVTLYSGQWKRLLGYGEKLAAFIASNPTAAYPVSALKSDEDKAFIAEVRQGKHPHASISPDGENLVVKLAVKAE